MRHQLRPELQLGTPARPTGWAADRFAAQTVLTHARGAAALLTLTGPRGWIAFARVYAFFRVWDDRVDAPDRDPETVRAALAAERARRSQALPAPTLEALAVDRALAALPALEPAVAGMWAALEADAHRPAVAMPAAWLDAQAARIGDAYAGALWACAGEPGPPPDGALALSRAATRAHWVRDLEEDLALGYINVPAEVCAAQGLDPARPAGPALQAWAASEARDAAHQLGPRFLAGGWRARALLGGMARRYRALALGLAGSPR